ncbi:DNA-binding protein, partial [Salmonella enterica subsp. enterica serovar Enteritidis]|nr:DNA-binding protein [Salmonella enterica subsp. enterica serovar Enteritidis]
MDISRSEKTRKLEVKSTTVISSEEDKAISFSQPYV